VSNVLYYAIQCRHCVKVNLKRVVKREQPFRYFDQHDTNGDGDLDYTEFKNAQSQLAQTGEYSMWPRTSAAAHNAKGTVGYHDDNAAHLWDKLDSFHDDYGTEGAKTTTSGDGRVTKDEWTHGIMGFPRNTICDIFESTSRTHGGNLHKGFCNRRADGRCCSLPPFAPPLSIFRSWPLLS
jgi:hypothetical protein